MQPTNEKLAFMLALIVLGFEHQNRTAATDDFPENMPEKEGKAIESQLLTIKK